MALAHSPSTGRRRWRCMEWRIAHAEQPLIAYSWKWNWRDGIARPSYVNEFPFDQWIAINWFGYWIRLKMEFHSPAMDAFGSEENRIEYLFIHNRLAHSADRESTKLLFSIGIENSRARAFGFPLPQVCNGQSNKLWMNRPRCTPLSSATTWRRQRQPDATYPSGCQTALIELKWNWCSFFRRGQRCEVQIACQKL